MADIAPFRGLRYNAEKISDLAQVVIPPYDVISPREQEAFHESSPYNMVRIELGKGTPTDSAVNNAHSRAARYLSEWQREGVLVRDPEPAMYYYELDYSVAPHIRQTRYGFFCALRLEDFASGAVRPHERTFQAVKDERLGLMMACHANLSAVFALYSDPSLVIHHTLKAGKEDTPVIRFRDRSGMDHRVWRVKDLQVLRQVRTLMKDKAIFIADGHHRYETALNYRAIQRNHHPEAGPRASFEYIMMYLSNLNQGGLTILPTHRLIRNCSHWDLPALMPRLDEFFQVSTFEATESGKGKWLAALQREESRKKTAIGFYCGGAENYYLLVSRDDPVFSYLESHGIPKELQRLDVVVLDKLVLRHILSLPEGFLGNENNIHFKHDVSEAVSDVESGKFQAGFFINPTRIEQVQEVASAGLIMPHKSTYFYPKVGSGLVINPLSPKEEMIW